MADVKPNVRKIDVTNGASYHRMPVKTERFSPQLAPAFDKAQIFSQIQFDWYVRGFTEAFVLNGKIGNRIESDSFEVAVGKIRTKWSLRLYPNGADDEHCIGIYLIKKAESSQNYKYKARFSFMDGEEELHYQECQFEKSLNLGTSLGFGDFMPHETFFSRNDELLNNSNLSIRVVVTLSAPKSEGKVMSITSVE